MPFVEHASKAVLGWGAFLQVGTTVGGGSPGTDTFTNISEVISHEPPDEQADDIEVTHFGSPLRSKEYIRGLLDTGEAPFTVNYNPAQYPEHVTLVQLKKSGEKRNIRFVLPSAMETIDFVGYVKGFKRNIEPSGAMTADITLKVAGAVSSDIAP
jgi:hypothetical protein